MKVTKELKDIIARKLQEKEKEEKFTEFRRREEVVKNINDELSRSDEFKNLVAAATAWQDKINKVYESVSDIAILRRDRYGATASWDMSVCLERKDCPTPLIALNPDPITRNKYVDIQDTILLKLSYGSDFEEAKAILESYGLTID